MARQTTPVEQLEQLSVEDLRRRHGELEERLKNLHRPRSMSPQEESEVSRIKKEKLAIKDRLMQLDAT